MLESQVKKLQAAQAGSLTQTLDNPEYPRRWSQYVGQEPAVKMLKVAAASARIRKEPMEHILIAHPAAGIGKTALANLIGIELRRPVKVVSGKVTLLKARMILSQMKDRDVLFYDEFHQVGEGDWLLPLLQDGVLMGPKGIEPQPRITLIAATTHPQKVARAVTERFMLVPLMQEYTTEEAAKIAQSTASRILVGLPKLTKADAMKISDAASNNPRSIKKLVMSLRDMTITKTLPLVRGRYNVTALLAWHGITPDGLDVGAQRYLEALSDDFGGQAGVKALEERLQQPGGLGDTERALMERGLVARTRTGRMLTQAGMSRVNEMAG